jgi:predicted ribosomally synthesized peptide with SipW-like signal peptide
MINKKILLSVFTIGLLACVAGAGTWAYFQDTVTSSGNTITTATLTSKYELHASGTWIPFSGDTDNTFGPFNFSYAVPDDTDKVVEAIEFENTGNTPATVIATITPVGTVPDVAGLTITVGDQTIYSSGTFTTTPVTLGTAGAAGVTPVDGSVKYTYTDSGSQNDNEDNAVVFDMSVAEKAIQAP